MVDRKLKEFSRGRRFRGTLCLDLGHNRSTSLPQVSNPSEDSSYSVDSRRNRNKKQREEEAGRAAVDWDSWAVVLAVAGLSRRRSHSPLLACNLVDLIQSDLVENTAHCYW